MKLLIMIGILFISDLSQARIMNPIEDNYSYILENVKCTNKNKTACEEKKEYKPCAYQNNDYRSEKDSVFGCAVNNNRKKSSDIGDICN